MKRTLRGSEIVVGTHYVNSIVQWWVKCFNENLDSSLVKKTYHYIGPSGSWFPVAVNNTLNFFNHKKN